MFFSKITKIILYVVAGISVLVILFFYAGPKLLDYDNLERRVEEITNPADLDMEMQMPVETPATAEDSAETALDTASVGQIAAQGPGQQGGEAAEEGGAFSTVEEVIDTSGVNLREHLSTWEYLVWFRTDIALIWAYILLLLTAIATIVFPLITVFSNPRALIRLAGILAGAAVLVVLAYLFSSDTPINIIGYTGEANRDPATLRMVDTTLYVTYMLFGLALLSILYSIISRAFK
jgi:hypothetical protein